MNAADVFTVVLGNVYVNNRHLLRTIRALVAGAPDVIVINEGRHAAKRPVRRLLARLGYRLYVSPYGDPRGRTDVLLYVHKRNRHKGFLSLRVASALEAFPAAHERYLLAVLLETALGPVAVLGLHPTPGPNALRGTDPDAVLVRLYGGALETALGAVDYLEGEGYRVILAGDLQARVSWPTRPWSPDVVLQSGGMTVTLHEGLDVIAHGTGLEPVQTEVLARAGEAGDHDHDLLGATYRRVRPRNATPPLI